MVKIAVAGAKGHMGKMIIDAVWNMEGAELVAALAHKGTDKWEADEDAGASLGYNTGVKITDDYSVLRTSGAQVLIDFTRPEGTKEFLKICSDAGIGMVIGTTGLDAEGKAAIEEAAKVIPIVFSPNMSVGVNVTYKLLELAAKLLKDYDAEIFEMHLQAAQPSLWVRPLQMLEDRILKKSPYGRVRVIPARECPALSVLRHCAAVTWSVTIR